MSRPLRLEFHGALYHLTARGDGRDEIFLDDADRVAFLEVFAQGIEQFNWTVHAYCLMDNHYHLLVETPDGNLSKGMRQLNGVYTQRFNRRHQRVGHVFQGQKARPDPGVVYRNCYQTKNSTNHTLPIRSSNMSFVIEIPSAEDIETYQLPYMEDLQGPIELRRPWTADRDRGIYMIGPGGIGKQEHDEELKRYFDVYLGRTKLRVILKPKQTPGDYKANPYYIHWPALLEIWALHPRENRLVEIYKAARQNPDAPNPYLRNYSLNEFMVIFKEAVAVCKEGYYNKFIHAPIVVSFGF